MVGPAASVTSPFNSLGRSAQKFVRLCGAGHCPRIAELMDRETPASVFDV
jgi:hypothetical protein